MGLSKDDLLWQSFVRDRNAGFEPFYNYFYERLLMFCLGKLKHLDLAENAVADLFIKILAYPKLMEIESPENWIFTLARNYCNTYWSKENRRAQILSAILDPMDKFVERESEIKLDLATLEAIIEKKLKKHEYQIWKLDLAGFSNEEIAKELSLSKKTIANKKTLIRQQLDQVVSEFFQHKGKMA